MTELYKKGDTFLRIEQDMDPESPREDENVGVMVTWHKRYILGDEQPKEDPYEYKEALPEGTIALSIFMYDHSGITLSMQPFDCPWDSGQLGFIYATPEHLKEMGLDGRDRKVIEKYLKSEIDIYSAFLEGQVYGFTTFKHKTCGECGHVEEEDIDSCWGFIGSDYKESGLLEHAGVEDLDDWEEQ